MLGMVRLAVAPLRNLRVVPASLTMTDGGCSFKSRETSIRGTTLELVFELVQELGTGIVVHPEIAVAAGIRATLSSIAAIETC